MQGLFHISTYRVASFYKMTTYNIILCVPYFILPFPSYCLFQLLLQTMLQEVSSYMYPCSYMNLYKEFLEVRFLDQSIYAMIILIDTGKMHCTEKINLHDCQKCMSAYFHVSCYLFFADMVGKNCPLVSVSLLPLLPCSPKMDLPSILVPTCSEEHPFHNGHPHLSRHRDFLASHLFPVVIFG